MTSPGGTRTLCKAYDILPVPGSSASLIGSELSSLLGSDPLPWIETFVTFCGMVGLQAMVLGRLGRKPSLIQERVLYPAHRHLRAGAPTPPRVRGSGPSLFPTPIRYEAIDRAGVSFGVYRP
jgi:hypothetical protein